MSKATGGTKTVSDRGRCGGLRSRSRGVGVTGDWGRRIRGGLLGILTESSGSIALFHFHHPGIMVIGGVVSPASAVAAIGAPILIPASVLRFAGGRLALGRRSTVNFAFWCRGVITGVGVTWWCSTLSLKGRSCFRFGQPFVLDNQFVVFRGGCVQHFLVCFHLGITDRMENRKMIAEWENGCAEETFVDDIVDVFRKLATGFKSARDAGDNSGVSPDILVREGSELDALEALNNGSGGFSGSGDDMSCHEEEGGGTTAMFEW